MLDPSAVLEARDRIDDLVVHTPTEYSPFFSDVLDCELSLKQEVFQRTGAFKIRGAANRIRQLSAEERDAGVVTASAGNHAQGVAMAATASEVDSIVVMPEDAAISKVAATRSYGADVRLTGSDYAEAQQVAHDIATDDGRTYVHAFDDPAVMAGQGTIGLEVLEDVPDVDTIVVPIGGGGLIGGIATAARLAEHEVRVIGVQARGAASVPQSLDQGAIFERESVDTIADGIATRRVGDLPYAVIEEHVDEVITVRDDDIAVAVTRLLERSKVLVEPAGAVGVAGLLTGRIAVEPEETVVPVLSGGNIDLNVLTTILVRGLVQTGRYAKLRTILKDKPGALEELSSIIAGERANIYAIRHDRTSRDVAMNRAEVELELETRGEAHLEEVIEALESRGYVADVDR